MAGPSISRRRLLGTAVVMASGSAVAGCTPDAEVVDYRTDGVSFALTNVVVFDGEQVIDADTVVVRDGLIAGVGAALSVPDDLPKRDGQGRQLLPGLIDAHAHGATWFANASLRFGVTTLLEMAGVPSPGEVAAREDVARDDAADVWSAGFMVTVPGGTALSGAATLPSSRLAPTSTPLSTSVSGRDLTSSSWSLMSWRGCSRR